jgi:hypothetical protein
MRAGAVNVGEPGVSADEYFACDRGATEPALLLNQVAHIVPGLSGSEEEWAEDGAKPNHAEHQDYEQRSDTLALAGIRP